jgi:hypothetical protein
MTEEVPTLTRHDLEAKIVKRCWEDEAFHQEFAADPVGTAVKYLQVPAANLPNIVVHEEPAGSWHIVLPAKPAEAGELSEDDLERISGGTSPATPLIAMGTAIITGMAAGGGMTASAIITVNKGW